VFPTRVADRSKKEHRGKANPFLNRFFFSLPSHKLEDATTGLRQPLVKLTPFWGYIFFFLCFLCGFFFGRRIAREILRRPYPLLEVPRGPISDPRPVHPSARSSEPRTPGAVLLSSYGGVPHRILHQRRFCLQAVVFHFGAPTPVPRLQPLLCRARGPRLEETNPDRRTEHLFSFSRLCRHSTRRSPVNLRRRRTLSILLAQRVPPPHRTFYSSPPPFCTDVFSSP